ncbi:transmembrane protein 81 isoform X2 [Manis javanica]|uniref:transmembrane protein 81 isoform X2 n=1 Tax=Manis javanica TaxID=9974 RepID=UPI000812E2B1|nr:transmembrane protein 81 [Manis javanica]KAI5939734.1 Transmembrane protein 81 [Manis javanica]
MKALAVDFLLGSLVLAACLPLVVTSPNILAIPEKLQQAVGKVVVSATPCTVTCGLGYKQETVCEVGPDGVRRKCKSQRLECLTNWVCGMLHFTILVGEELELSCLSADTLEVGQEAFWFTWRLARGIISTDDEVFKPFSARSHFVKFRSAQEYDSGTYRCDVLLLKNLRLVKRLYFGLRVLPPNLVSLNFHQSLTEDQKLVDKGLEVSLGNYSRPHHPPWRKKVPLALGIGIACGVAGGVLVSIVLCSGLMASCGGARLKALQALFLKCWPPGGLDWLLRKLSWLPKMPS